MLVSLDRVPRLRMGKKFVERHLNILTKFLRRGKNTTNPHAVSLSISRCCLLIIIIFRLLLSTSPKKGKKGGKSGSLRKGISTSKKSIAECSKSSFPNCGIEKSQVPCNKSIMWEKIS